MKQKITITEIKEPIHWEKDGKTGTKYPFRATSDGKELNYQTYAESIFNALKKDLSCEIEFESKSREYEGNTYTDRNVSQMWIDSKPVREEKQYKGGWSPRENPETLKSIEIQTTTKELTELIIAGKDVPGDLLTAYWSRHRDVLKDYLTKSSPKGDKSEPDKQSPSPMEDRKFRNQGEFLTACLKELKLGKTHVMSILKTSADITDLTQISDYGDAWLIVNKNMPEVK